MGSTIISNSIARYDNETSDNNAQIGNGHRPRPENQENPYSNPIYTWLLQYLSTLYHNDCIWTAKYVNIFSIKKSINKLFDAMKS